MEIVAQLKSLQPVVEKGTFKSRKVWAVLPDEKYIQTLEFELHQDKVDILNGVAPGSEVKFYLNLRGREWTGTDGVVKVFNSFVCWKVDVLTVEPLTTKVFTPSLPKDDGDLPF